MFKLKMDFKTNSEMGKCKTKAIQVDLGIFTDIQELFRYIQDSGIFIIWHIQNQMHIQNSGIFKTLAHSKPEIYSESWSIQNPGMFRIGGILTTLPNNLLWNNHKGNHVEINTKVQNKIFLIKNLYFVVMFQKIYYFTFKEIFCKSPLECKD